MNQEIKRMLEEEIKSQIADLSYLETGSKEKSSAVADLDKLYRLGIEEEKTERGFQDDIKKRLLSEQALDRYLKYGIELFGTISMLVFYGCWMRRGFKFEETGTFTSTTFRGLFGRFRPTK